MKDPGADLATRPGLEEASPALLRLQGIEVVFHSRRGLVEGFQRRANSGVRAVDGIDLEIQKGEILGLVGESGSGKTTTARVVSKLTQPTGGRLEFDGVDVTNVRGRELRQYRQRIAVIFQDPYETLNPQQSIFDFVAEPLVVSGVARNAKEREDRVYAALESAGMRPARAFARRFPHELSGGQRQRVVIAGALVLDPELVIADEPVSMLDVSIRTELLQLMLALRTARDLTYLFITHDLALAWVIADRIAVMYLGKIMEIGPANKVISAPRHPYTAALVSVAPSPEPPAPGERAKRTILVGETPDAAAIPTGCRFRTRCPLAFEKCVEEPPLFDVGGGQSAACWLAEQASTEGGIADLLPNAGRPTGLASPAAQQLASPAD